ncbi:hypothetical protein WR25_15774 [Diploscapter pachys]|uniref:Uncharacterized protein n=1 Tax=Diploscapter pachys TaxID=2018661 RepID=A0A2A2JXL1_9BILA|nr:hypothetical protein WR25_15774 [Diploscapter pachys]
MTGMRIAAPGTPRRMSQVSAADFTAGTSHAILAYLLRVGRADCPDVRSLREARHDLVKGVQVNGEVAVVRVGRTQGGKIGVDAAERGAVHEAGDGREKREASGFSLCPLLLHRRCCDGTSFFNLRRGEDREIGHELGTRCLAQRAIREDRPSVLIKQPVALRLEEDAEIACPIGGRELRRLCCRCHLGACGVGDAATTNPAGWLALKPLVTRPCRRVLAATVARPIDAHRALR